MDLRSLTLVDLMPFITKVERALEDDEQTARLLDAATQDTPIVFDLVEALGMLSKRKGGPEKNPGFAIARGHLVIFLALRELERANVANPGTGRNSRARRRPDDQIA